MGCKGAMLRVWSVSGQELSTATGGAPADVRALKCHLRSQQGFPVCLQQVLQDGRCLEDWVGSRDSSHMKPSWVQEGLICSRSIFQRV